MAAPGRTPSVLPSAPGHVKVCLCFQLLAFSVACVSARAVHTHTHVHTQGRAFCGGSRYWVGTHLPQRRSSAAPGVGRLGAGRNTTWRCFTTAGQSSRYSIVELLLTWIECSFCKRCGIHTERDRQTDRQTKTHLKPKP
jgi:hypothetical protein